MNEHVYYYELQLMPDKNSMLKVSRVECIG